MNPSLNICTITLDELMTFVENNARDFRSCLRKVATEEQMADYVVTTFRKLMELNQDEKSVGDNDYSEPENKLRVCEEIWRSDEPNVLMKWLEFPFHTIINDHIDLLGICVKTGYNMTLFRGKENDTLLHTAVSKSVINLLRY